MTDESHCIHLWGDTPELVETSLGELCSPLCQHCGAVKLEEEHRAHERRRQEIAARLINRPTPLATSIPPAGAPPVHPFQSQLFTDV
jgi:hypothetical protein